VNEWDALNHPVHRNLKEQERDSKGRGLMVHEWMQRDLYAEVLQRAHSNNPALRLYLNESDILTRQGTRFPEYLQLARHLQQRKLPLHGIGCMAHFRPDNLPAMSTLENRLDSLAKLQLPIKITEFDVQFGQPMQPYTQTTQELQLQKRFTEDFLTLCFSHPAVEGIIMWGFWEKAHYHPAAALWDSDWNIKPNGRTWLDAVCQKWWSQHTFTQSIPRQQHPVRLFKGEHELRISDAQTGDELYRCTLIVGEKNQNLNINLRR
jgi:GH35 family endo-1,4-beta-xylanase